MGAIGDWRAHRLTFEADDTAMNHLKVLRFDDYSEEWAKFIC